MTSGEGVRHSMWVDELSLSGQLNPLTSHCDKYNSVHSTEQVKGVSLK